MPDPEHEAMLLTRSATTTALVVRGSGQLGLEDWPLPVVKATDVLVDVIYGGICGSDLHYWMHGASGSAVLRQPMVLGHEVVGRVATSATGLPAGTPVAIHPASSCGSCRECLAERPNLCRTAAYLGSAARFPHSQGAFARQIVVPLTNVRVLPNDVPLISFAMAEPAAVAWHAVTLLPRNLNSVLIVGAGPIGLALVAIVRALGAFEVAVTDLHARPIVIAEQLGAVALPYGGAVGDYDAVFECSGSNAGMRSAIEMCRPGGSVILVGNQVHGNVPFPASQLITKEIQVRGSYRFHEELDDVIAAIGNGKLDLSPIVTHVLDFREYTSAFDLASDAETSSKVLLTFN